ncbi:MAG: zinc-dependent metalloprotease [Kordiimonadaceae bacterium]|nr:zinc-dependent metalloprotease [Kordiimonadaceae bacterium]MBO6569153.1 zinc-dependent metalloprotease [Kordiimonadaceae bacterium]MBO6964629.1 zinc-dependent metalloprotease [Kordiimonadaceae bacterium]
MRIKIFALVSLLMASAGAVRSDFAEAVANLEPKSGLLEAYVDTRKNKVLLALTERPDGTLGRYIYAAYLTGGLGSNPVGLDRSRPSDSYILAFKRSGDQVYAFIENHRYRATADNPSEKRAVETSFAQSIIWSGPIAETAEDGRLLVDFTSFLMRDGVGVAEQLKRRGQGSFKIDSKRSFVDTTQTHVFERNFEADAFVTFTGADAGGEVRATTPVPDSVSLVLHTTLLALPEDGYEPRIADERGGVISTSHIDMSADLTGNTAVQLARRFRLELGPDGKVVNPIVFYIDNGAPEPIRGALLEGAQWWADAFEAAGFPGGYRAEILPEGVHPLDARYNMVNWVHRATRGWSYGASIYDPRTGEILRGVVLLGSLRVRQDIKIFEALAGAGKTGTGDADDPVEIALARIRQLSAHEIGHALGFSHNMAASSYGRASVMDYPAPDIRAKEDGALDFSNAYGVGVGAWDKWVTKYLYADYDDTDPSAKRAVFKEADDAGLLYVSDGDSRSVGSGHIRGSLWDNGSDAVAELGNVMQVRATALSNFGPSNLRSGESYSALQTKFVPLYLYHRYQLQAAAKFVGGYDFVYRAEGDGRPAPEPVEWSEQLRALDALLNTLSPDTLSISPEMQSILSPRGAGGGDPQFQREAFSGTASPAFSTDEAVATAADLTLDALLHPRRLQRLVEQGRSTGHEGLSGVLDRTIESIMRTNRRESAADTAVRAVVLERLVEHLIAHLDEPATGVAVRAKVRTGLADILQAVDRSRGGLAEYGGAIVKRIEDAFARARTPAVKTPSGPTVPPGSPIGASSAEACWHGEG